MYTGEEAARPTPRTERRGRDLIKRGKNVVAVLKGEMVQSRKGRDGSL